MSRLYRAPKPVKAVSETRQRRAPFLAAEKTRLLRRVGNRCEGCGATGIDTDRHHVFGREGTGARLGFPWCHYAELSAALCRDCHTALTDGKRPELDARLKFDAIGRFAGRFDIARADVGGRDMFGAIRLMVQIAEEMEREQQ